MVRFLGMLLLLAGFMAAALGAPEPAKPVVSNLGTPPAWKGWDRMTVTMPGFMSKNDTLQLPDFLLKIWAKEIAANDQQYRDQGLLTGGNGRSLFGTDGHAPADALYTVYRDGDRTIVVSMLDTAKACEDGPNDFSSNQIHSTCPVRLTVIRGQRMNSVDTPDACFLDATYDVAPGESREGFPDPRINASLTRYNRPAGTVEVIAIRDNKSLPDCAKRLKVPPL
jgi:hypothetical protein